jgi:hypothetical protein
VNLWVVQFRFDLLSILGNDLFFFGLMAFGAKNALTKKFPWNTNVNVWMDVYGW